jgi:DNA topoisomerase-1
MGIDVNNNFVPRYKISDEKKKVVSELKAAAKKSDEVWLASDEDREGESISWHLAEVLNLNPETTKRIVFHEITKPAIQKAVANPRTINMDLVNAQQARRVVDRLVGFELSPLLWRKIGMRGNLSAGRVQSVAVRLLVEREREINAFKAESSFKIIAQLSALENGKNISFKAEAKPQKNGQSAEQFLQSCIGASYSVNDLAVRPGKRTPAAPFTTSTLQQEASRKLGYGVSKTMMVAQRLYENGHITYMRTDSVNLSDTALGAITTQVSSQFGENYHQFRKFKNKNESAQEAHEAIRPTYMENMTTGDPELDRLYELIWKRTMASQMADAVLEKTTAKILISTNKEELTATGEVIKFDGFLKLYIETTDEELDEDETKEDARLPQMTIGDEVGFIQMNATEKYSRPPARYTEASLVKKMEELGIGRPSTYAPTISTILKRTYAEKREALGTRRDFQVMTLTGEKISKEMRQETTGADKGKLIPTDLGALVTDFLSNHFIDIMDYKFTAGIEEQFDKIASGNLIWNNMVGEFYRPFHKKVDETMENAGRATAERELGTDPATGLTIITRMGRYGAMIQLGKPDEIETPKYVSLKQGQSLETVTLQEALDLLKMGESLGQYEGVDISAGVGRYGPYIKVGDQFISIPRGEDPEKMTYERALQIIKDKEEGDAPIGYYQDLPITKGKGRFGPFIKWNGLFMNIPARGYDFDNLTQENCNELIAKKLDKEANRYIIRFLEEKIDIENGRWGPFIRWNKKMLKLIGKGSGEKGKYTDEELQQMPLEAYKAMIVEQVPNAFTKKAATKKSTPAKKVATKKAPAKKAAVKKQ